ncbi:FGFR1 oncogene partner 2 homolog isoform X2 [Pomacea canaliculata]|uniref:FGFR1 oncogene partner 2 homolog isoform X2 n=1 Tax=Pomacea canaliculata TaxID=400727 RepID=UPI000D725391|nr:FGFR1 oncogene partner 2 homolog isoform X2 [Pomacea canaliculata]
MSLTVEKLLGDARMLVTRLKEQDHATDSLISTTQTLQKRIDAMKQYQDDLTELNEIAKHRPRSALVIGIAQENRQIRELQQEKRELALALEEHQSALQLIMHKYRQHTVSLLHANRMDAALASRTQQSQEVCHLMDKMKEMASVMQQAVRVDDENAGRLQERLAQLEVENQTLRQLLEICSTAKHPILSLEDFGEESQNSSTISVIQNTKDVAGDGASGDDK